MNVVPASTASTVSVSRADIEDVFFNEARLLDRWDLAGWLELFTPDARYLIPSTDKPNSTPDSSLFLVADDRKGIEMRVKQLNSPSNWVENPRSRTRRLISNVCIVEQSASEICAEASFAIWRFKNDQIDTYIGHYRNVFSVQQGGILIREKRAVLDLETLRPHGKISFIL